MNPALRRAARRLLAAASLLAACAGGARGAPAAEEKPKRDRGAAAMSKIGGAQPGAAPVMSAGRIEQTAPGEYLLTGDVDFSDGSSRLLADTVRYSESGRTVTAEGNVVAQLGNNQISGDRIEVNLDTRFATIDNARGYFDPDVILDAERLERIGEETFRITNGTITTCTQPTPYWSFHVGSATVTLGRYAHMRSASFRIGKVPFFWSPYLVWPVKEDRAPGLLLPHFGFTGKRGAFLSSALYLPLGRSADATLQFDFFNGATQGTVEQLPQAGQGLEARFVPSENASGGLTAYYLRERFRPFPGSDAEERSRYHVSLVHTQRLAGGFKVLVDVNTVSDLDYFLDFEREIRYSTTPTVFSQVDLSKQEGPWALNVRLNRQLQFIAVDPDTQQTEDLTLWRLPEVELRGRGIRIGRSRFYLTFESSLDGFARRTRTVDPLGGLAEDQAKYSRFVLFPTVSGNFTPVPWLDISPTLSFRETYYTASDADPGATLDPRGDPVLRQEYRLGLSVVGPRVYRLYGSEEEGRTRWKHTFEPRVAYDYVPDVGGGEKLIPFDEIDAAIPSNNLLGYSMTSRLFAKRPERKAEPARPASALSASFASLVLGEEPPTRHAELSPPPDAGAAAAAPPAADANAPAAAPAPGGEPGAEAPAAAPPSPAGGDTYVAPDLSTLTGEKTPFGGAAATRSGARGREPSVGAVEIASFDLTQRYSLDDLRPLSRSSALDTTSAFSPVEATIRYNPTNGTSVDLRATYDILFHDIRSVSLSGNLRSRDAAYLRLSWFLNRDLEGTPASQDIACASDPTRVVGREGEDPGRCFSDSSQIRLLGGVALLRRKITADVEGSYDIDESFLRDQRYRIGYNTQCCGVLVEIAKRSFLTSSVGATSETEYRFVLNLRGVGTFLDLNGRPQ